MRPLLLVPLAAALAGSGCVDPSFDAEADEPPATEPTAAAGPIALPIEVMPYDGPSLLGNTFVESRAVDVSAADASALVGGSLYLRGHELAYRDGSTVATIKASVRWDSGTWVELVNPTALPPSATDVVVDGLDAIYGGIGGGFRTVRVRVPFARLCGSTTCVTAGTHTIGFRWGGTDGTGSGYRVVELNLRTTAGVDRLVASAFTQDDPTTWTPPRPGAADIAEGDRLFHARSILVDKPGGRAMIASCSDCHARDGGDLEYFAFSNRSIANRSVFHGLSWTQGEQIASYVRTNPALRWGRPWNPPYQPGPGRDALGAHRWAAGAGLDAVQPETAALLDVLFPTGHTDPVTMAHYLRNDANNPLPAHTTNLRELPLQIQLPDWNSWLPEVHPVDLWGATNWDAGDGTFDLAQVTTFPLLASASGLAVGDFDSDTRVDLAAALPLASRLWVLTGDANGVGTVPTTVYMGTTPMAVAIADLTGDGRADLASANFDSDDVTVRPGDGAGGFGAIATRASGDGPRAIVSGDWNNDGKTDLAVAQYLADRVAIHLGNGTPLVAAPITRAAGDGPIDLAAADMNGDGKLDLVAVSSLTNQVLVFPGLGTGALGAPTALAVGAAPQAVAVGDLDRDGRLDLVVANQNGSSLSVIRRNSAGGYLAAVTVNLTGQPADVALADLDEDGDLDAVVSLRTTDSVLVELGNGAGGFAGKSTFPVTGGPGPLAVTDVDLDSCLDAVVASSTLAQLTVQLAHRGFDRVLAPSVVQAYQQARATLNHFDPNDSAQVADLPYTLGPVSGAGVGFVSAGGWLSNGGGDAGGFRTTRGTVLDAAVVRGYSMELVKRSLAQWLAVKQWEIMHAYDLEALGPGVFGTDDGEVLSWPMGAHESVFAIAPHILSANRDFFRRPSTYPEQDACRDPGNAALPGCQGPILDADQSARAIKGDYDSTAWYHLQMLLHAGARSRHPSVDPTSAVSPVDWPYAMMHVDDLDRRAADNAALIPGSPSAWEPVRYLATMMKAYQMRDNGKGPALTGWSMRDVSPRLLVSNWRGEAGNVELLEKLDTLPNGTPNTRGAIASAFLLVFDQVTSSNAAKFDSAHWPRFVEPATNDRETWWNLDPADHTVSRHLAPMFPSGGPFSHADDMWAALPLLRLIPGIELARVDALRDWAALMWTGTDWTGR